MKAGAKTGEIQAQQSTIVRLQAELAGEIAVQNAAIARWQSEVQNALTEYNRFQQLYQQGAISTSNLDSKRLVAETAQAQLNQANMTQTRTVNTLKAQLGEAKATLNRIAEVRPVDIQAAQTEIENATAAVKKAQTDLEQADIKAPIAGRILKIHTRTGEKIGDAGIADLAQTEQMVAVAEVYQILYSDVADHLPEYATLKAMGYSDRYLLGVLLQEALLLAVLGYIPGFLISIALYQLTYTATLLPIGMTLSRAITVFLLTVAMCSFSAAISMRKLQSADPADVF